MEKLSLFLFGVFVHQLKSLYKLSLVYPGIGSLLQFLDEILRLLQIHAGQMADILDQILKEFCLKGVGLVGDERTRAEYNFLGHFWIGG